MLLGGGGVARAQCVCQGPVSPSSLKRSTYRDKIYNKIFEEGCLGNPFLGTPPPKETK